VSTAGGSPGQWYLHLFTAEQPDLDWTNESVRSEFDSILRFWLDRGIDGFRIDVAHGLAKDPAMPDLAGRYPPAGAARAGHPHWDRDEVHSVYRRWRQLTDDYEGDRAFVAEAWVDSPERLARYLRPGELHTAFNFNFLLAPWDAGALRDVIDRTIQSLAAVDAPPTWVLSNHDVIRHVTRYGGGELGTRRARAAVLLMLALPGGAYVYQGEELGLPEVTDLPDEVLQDPTFVRSGGERRGRDGCRVPLPWSGKAPPFGFGPSGTSWLPPPVDWAGLTADHQASDPASMLTLYRRALRLRRELAGLGDQPLTWMDAGPGMLAFRRGPGFACVVNLGRRPVAGPAEVDGDEPLLTSEPHGPHGPIGRHGPDGRVPGDTAVWYRGQPDRRSDAGHPGSGRSAAVDGRAP
jgi:alpha-glucosidase